jgi:hypothetical protein
MGQNSQLDAATAVKLPTASGQLLAGSRVLLGLEVADATHGQAHIHVYNGTSNQGTLVATALPPNGEHDTRWYGPNGIKCPNGIYVEVISGTPSGSLFYR